MQNSKLHIFHIMVFILLTSCASSYRSNKKITVIAHRGASGYLPEHTLESATLAHSFNVDFIEPDLVLTKDNQLILMHDIYLDTTTNVSDLYPSKKRKDGRYYAIDFTLKQIKRLSVHERIKLSSRKRYFEGRFPLGKSSFKVPTFIEFLELIKGLNLTRRKNIGIYPEIKHPSFHLKHKKDITKIFMAVLRDYGIDNNNSNMIIQCFDPKTLKRLKSEFKTSIKLVQLIADNSWDEADVDFEQMQTKAGLLKISKYAEGIGPWVSQLLNKTGNGYKATNLVRDAHDLGLIVHPYTHRVDKINKLFKSESEFLDFLINDLKVDGLFSDFSDRIVKRIQ